MITFFSYDETINKVKVTESVELGNIIVANNPNDYEIDTLNKLTGIAKDKIYTCLDSEEVSRLSINDDENIFIVLNIPILVTKNNYDATPLGIIITKNHIVLISLLPKFEYEDIFNVIKANNFTDETRGKFILHLIKYISKSFIHYIKEIISISEKLEEQMFKKPKNEHILATMHMRRSLTFFAMSLYANDLVVSRIVKLKEKEYMHPILQFKTLNEELLENASIENKQAMEMVSTYSKVNDHTMDTFGSTLANNQNSFIKLLTNITILITIPMIFAGFWGMNVEIPFGGTHFGFWFVTGLSLVIIIITLIYLWKKRLLK